MSDVPRADLAIILESKIDMLAAYVQDHRSALAEGSDYAHISVENRLREITRYLKMIRE